VCCLEFTFLEQSAVVCPHCENDNERKQTPCSFIVYEPKIKEIYSFFQACTNANGGHTLLTLLMSKEPCVV
jgi:hypothetical protein